MKTTNSILCVIASVIAAGQNQISITELVSLSGISRQSVKRAIQILEQAGQITVTRTTAAWRLQIVVWQNMSFQSNHPE
ncbi:winged helix-turn-helix transcriptional regulator [Escherichia coli]|nr:winged helix-turn-helix transcriptional regulator [Escherichia coli]